MNPIIYISSKEENYYDKFDFLSKIKDRFKIGLIGECYEKSLKLKIRNVVLPLNINEKAYYKNLLVAKKYGKSQESKIAPKVYRPFDFKHYNEFQKKLFAYSVIKSASLVLKKRNSSIRTGCIVVYDAAQDITLPIINKLGEEAKFIILVSKDNKRLQFLQDYLISQYGTTPVITSDIKHALSYADFVISSHPLQCTKPIWHLDNIFKSRECGSIGIDDITYNIPWDINKGKICFELLGAILSQMNEKDVEASLRYNEVYIDEIKFCGQEITL